MVLEELEDPVLLALNTPEDQQVGGVTKETYKELISALGGVWVVLLTIFIAVLGSTTLMYANKYLQTWSQGFNEDEKYEKLK